MTEKKSSGWGKGCGIAAAVGGAIVLVCGGVVTLLGYSVWQSPGVQRGVQIAGAAMEMTQQAMQGPGTAELRRAGCVQAMAYTPEIIRRFSDTIRPDGGTAGTLPEHPLVVCAVRRDSTMTCEEVARTYAGAVAPAPTEMGVTVQMQGQQVVCQGVYGADGSFLREAGADQQRIGNMGQTSP